MKYTFITTVTPGYMFALNCNFNTNKYYGTNADFHILHSSMEPDYMTICESAFPFKIVWIPMQDYGTFHTAKYACAKSLSGKYDSVCLIDADLFICCDVKPYFEKTAQEDILISAGHVWAGGDIEYLNFDNPDSIIDRCHCQLADFPVFINPTGHEKFFDDWINGTLIDYSHEISHPLVCFNRALCKNFKREQLMALPGHTWVCDQNYWDIDYIRQGDIMVNNLGERVCAIHNKWWKLGRSSGEWNANRGVNLNDTIRVGNLDKGERNFNAIRDFMVWFNDMTLETKRDDFFKDKHNWREYLKI